VAEAPHQRDPAPPPSTVDSPVDGSRWRSLPLLSAKGACRPGVPYIRDMGGTVGRVGGYRLIGDDRQVAEAGKRNVLGVVVDAVDYDAAVERVMDAARQRRPLSLTVLAVHGVMSGVRDPLHNARLSAIDVVTPDGQPVRWALNILYRTGLRDWVSGPELV